MEFLLDWGYLGLFIGTFVAATIVPFSSDLLIVGLLLAGGNPLWCFLSATIGNWLGGLTSYILGWLGKWEWIERWLKISKEKLLSQQSIIDRFGVWIALGSWLPFVGDIFAIGLGFYKINPMKSILFMLIGKALRFAFWIALYLFFGEKFLSLL